MTDDSKYIDPNDPNFRFVFDPNDPNYYSEVNNQMRAQLNNEQLQEMKNQAIAIALDSWIQNLDTTDMASLYLMLWMLNPFSSSKKDISFISSKYIGRLEQRMIDAGMNATPDELIKYILGD